MGCRYGRKGKGNGVRALLHMAAAAAVFFLTDSFGNEITGLVFRINGSAVFAAALLHVCLDILNVSLAVFLYGKYIVKTRPADMYLGKPAPALRWCAVAVIMPLAADCITILCTNGRFQAGHMAQGELVYLIFYDMVSVGVGAAAAEGILFWGLLFYLLRKELGVKRGIFFCGFHYGLARFILDRSFSWGGTDDDLFQLFAQFFFLVLMGTAFAFVTCETGSIWSAAVIHALFNILCRDSHILRIDTGQSFPAVFTYTVEKESLLLTGGVSWPAAAGFLVVIGMAAVRMRKEGHSDMDKKRQGI